MPAIFAGTMPNLPPFTLPLAHCDIPAQIYFQRPRLAFSCRSKRFSEHQTGTRPVSKVNISYPERKKRVVEADPVSAQTSPAALSGHPCAVRDCHQSACAPWTAGSTTTTAAAGVRGSAPAANESLGWVAVCCPVHSMAAGSNDMNPL